MITEISLFHAVFQVIFCIFGLSMLTFDTILLLATIASKSDQNIPYSYLIVMSFCGIFGKIVYIMDFASYLVLPIRLYLKYRDAIGKEVTFLGTYSYYIIIFMAVLMTVNRLYVMMRPLNNKAFNRRRIFWYSGGIAVTCAIVLLIPTYSSCPINFHAGNLEFASICPEPHVLSKLLDDNSFFIVIILLAINSSLVFYLKISNGIHKINPSTVTSSASSSLIQFQRRREQTLMKQAIGITLFLSIYEVGKFFNQVFPEVYNKIPVPITQSYFYFRFMSVLAINFFVYYLQSMTTRKMIRKYLGIGKKVVVGNAMFATATSTN